VFAAPRCGPSRRQAVLDAEQEFLDLPGAEVGDGEVLAVALRYILNKGPGLRERLAEFRRLEGERGILLERRDADPVAVAEARSTSVPDPRP
jgi:hypothetical protein